MHLIGVLVSRARVIQLERVSMSALVLSIIINHIMLVNLVGWLAGR